MRLDDGERVGVARVLDIWSMRHEGMLMGAYGRFQFLSMLDLQTCVPSSNSRRSGKGQRTPFTGDAVSLW
jgi:hypothetical protein